MITKYRDGVVPARPASTGLESDFDGALEKLTAQIDALELSGALEDVWTLVRRLNRFVEEQAPWKLAKDEAAADQLDAVLYGLAEGLRVVSILLHPFIPKSTQTLLTTLGHGEQAGDLSAARFGAGEGGFTVESLAPLFPKLEPSAA
jgi:methionyl-tRNA synthetase